MKDDTCQPDNQAICKDDIKKPDNISTYGNYTVKSYFVGEDDITDLIINYIDRIASLKF